MEKHVILAIHFAFIFMIWPMLSFFHCASGKRICPALDSTSEGAMWLELGQINLVGELLVFNLTRQRWLPNHRSGVRLVGVELAMGREEDGRKKELLPSHSWFRNKLRVLKSGLLV